MREESSWSGCWRSSSTPTTFIDVVEDCFHSKYLCNVFRVGFLIHHSRLSFSSARCLGGFSGEWLGYLYRHAYVHPSSSQSHQTARGGGAGSRHTHTRGRFSGLEVWPHKRRREFRRRGIELKRRNLSAGEFNNKAPIRSQSNICDGDCDVDDDDHLMLGDQKAYTEYGVDDPRTE